MSSGRPRQPNDPSVMASIEMAAISVRRANPVGVAWRWRWELGIVGSITAGAATVAIGLGIPTMATLLGTGLAAAIALLGWRPTRRWIAARAWCMITPHRVRVGCVHAWIQTRSGRLPAVLWTSQATYGERVLLWCPAGITAQHFEAAREILAAACWATDVRVYVHPRHKHLVALAVIRNTPERPGAMPARPWHSREDAEADDAQPGEPQLSASGYYPGVPANPAVERAAPSAQAAAPRPQPRPLL